MFGIFRFVLAVFVMVDHFPGGLLSNGGTYAVFGFFLLSGYLMTLVLNETYGFSGDGLRRFVTNRVLRIYPPYLVALLFAVCVFLLRSWLRGAPAPPLANPSVLDYLGQTLLLNLPGTNGARWIPPSWSLDVEIAYYAALLFLARGRGIVLAWLLLSLAFLGKQLWAGDNFLERYFTFASASLPFSLGSALYHFRGLVPRPSRTWAVVALAAFALNVLASRSWHDPLVEGFYVSLGLAFVVVAMLRDREALRPSQRLRRVDAWLGNLAYPLFLCHHAVGIGVGALLPWRMPFRSTALVVCAIVLSLLVAWGLHRLVEAPIAAWRDRVRPRRPVLEPAAPLLDAKAEPLRVPRMSS